MAQSTRGKSSASGNITNSVDASILAGVFDQNVVLTGQSTANATNNPNQLNFTTEK